MRLTVDMSCTLCSDKFQHEFDMPAGWYSRHDTVDIEDHGLCPKHESIAPFLESQCPGCVGGWGECDLFKAFAYSSAKRPLTEGDRRLLTLGYCPRRTNGTMSVNVKTGRVEDIDLTSGPEVAAGTALLAAIDEYTARYGKPKDISQRGGPF
jgi:hypothetical protein